MNWQSKLRYNFSQRCVESKVFFPYCYSHRCKCYTFPTQKYSHLSVKLQQQWNKWKVMFFFFTEVKKRQHAIFKHCYLSKVNLIHKRETYIKWCGQHDGKHTLLHAVYTSFINRELRSNVVKQRHKFFTRFFFLPSLVWNCCNPVRFKLDLRLLTKKSALTLQNFGWFHTDIQNKQNNKMMRFLSFHLCIKFDNFYQILNHRLGRN